MVYAVGTVNNRNCAVRIRRVVDIFQTVMTMMMVFVMIMSTVMMTKMLLILCLSIVTDGVVLLSRSLIIGSRNTG